MCSGIKGEKICLASKQVPTNGGRVEIGLPCMTSLARGPLKREHTKK